MRTQYLLFAALAHVCVSGCRTDASFAPPILESDRSSTYWSERATFSAIQLSTVSPYDTVTLHSVPFNPDGEPLQFDADTVNTTVTWVSADSSAVAVSAHGLLRARKGSSGTNVYVRRQIGTVTRADTILVRVSTLTDPPKLASLSIRPADSTKRGAGDLYMIPAIVRDQDSALVAGLPIAYKSDDVSIASFGARWTPWLAVQYSFANRSVTISASTYAYGTVLRDTFTLDAGWPVHTRVTGVPIVEQRVLRGGLSTTYAITLTRILVGPGTELYWENATGIRPAGYFGVLRAATDIDIIFDDPTDVFEAPAPNASGRGNILSIPGDSTLPVSQRRRYRRFVEAGEYPYTVNPLGLRGVIIVGDR